MKTIKESATHKIEIPDTAFLNPRNEYQEKVWRNSELSRTDTLMLLEDYPNKGVLKVYRTKLRNYPESENFPDGDRPTE